MNEPPEILDVSVIVVTYNRNAPLRQTLECLCNQNPAPREIIVVDQTKEHDEPTQQFLQTAITQGRIRYIFQPEPNAQRARNRAISEARGEVLLFVDDDVFMDESLVGAHWKNYDDPEISAVCGYYTEPGDHPTNELTEDCKVPITGWIYFPHSYTKRTDCYALPTCNGSIRKQVAIDLGGFDENYAYTLLDDTDLGCRLKAAGLKVIHDPSARLIHLKESTGGKRPGGINEYVIADRKRWFTWLYFFWMNFRWDGRSEISRRLRACIFRRKNLVRPWYLILAFWHFCAGVAQASGAIRKGRQLPVFHTTTLTDSVASLRRSQESIA